MNDTPRTDAAAVRCACSTYVVPSEFARELERENAALRADKERLDWIAQSPDKRLSRVHDLWVNDGDIADLRAAIDAARKEQREQKIKQMTDAASLDIGHSCISGDKWMRDASYYGK